MKPLSRTSEIMASFWMTCTMLPLSGIVCAQINGIPDHANVVAYDRFGEAIPMHDLVVPEAAPAFGGGATSCVAGWFNLVFTDNNTGFNDPIWGPTYRDIACRVFRDLSELIEPANHPYTLQPPSTGFVNIQMRLSPLQVPGVLAQGTSIYGPINFSNGEYVTPATMQRRVLDGEVWKTINGGYDSWIPQTTAGAPFPNFAGQLFHGRIQVDFNQFPNTSWHLNPAAPVPVPPFDLHSVIFHEALHTLGVASLINAAGGSAIGGSNYYSRWDTRLQVAGAPVVTNQWVCNAITYSGAALNGNCGMTFTGPNANEPAFSSAGFIPGTSLSHLDGTCSGGLAFLMEPAVFTGQTRIPTLAEAQVLCDLGYRTTTTVGTDPAWIGTVATNYPPCGSRIAGVDDMFRYATGEQYTYQQGQAAPLIIDDFLLNDEDQAKPNTVADEYDPCVEILVGGGVVNNITSTSIDYTPDPDFLGWAVLRYHPINSSNGTHGNYAHIFIMVEPSASCEDCNIVNGWDLESISSEYCMPYSNFRISGPMQGNTPDHMYFNGTNWVEDSGTPTGNLTYFNFCSSSPLPVPPSHNGAPLNQHYAAMVVAGAPGSPSFNQEGLAFELCVPMQPNLKYVLDFWARVPASPCNAVVDFRAFEQQPCTQAQGQTDVNGGAISCGGGPTFAAITFTAAQPLNNQWVNYTTAPFTFPPGPSANWLVAYASQNGGNGTVYIDDVRIRPVIEITGVVTNACFGQEDGLIDITVVGGSGTYEFSWSNSSTDEDPTGLAPGDYTVDVTDALLGCSATANFTVGSQLCGDPITVSKTVSTSQTYAGSPVTYTITVCNNTGSTIPGVTITDAIVFGDPQYFQLWPGYTNPLAGSGITIDLPPGCQTFTYVGFFTNLGTYLNEVHVDGPGNEDPWDNAIVNILEGCPLVVGGAGDCTEGPVTLCMAYHSVVPNVGAVEFDLIYPSFLSPPTDLSGATSSFTLSSNSYIGPAMAPPFTLPPGMAVVHVYIEFLNAPVLFAGFGGVVCIPFTVNSAPPPSQNVFYTGTIGNAGLLNFTTVFDPQGNEVDPPGFLTQAANIILTDCLVDGPNPQFTIQQDACTGIVNVQADFQDPAAIHIWTWGDNRTTPVNGASSYTYDYFAEITTTNGCTACAPIPPAAPGTYTITHTVILNGVASTSTQQVDVYPCCAAATIIPAGSTASSVNAYFTGPVAIQGDFLIDQDVTFENAEVTVAPGAQVLMEPGRYLRIESSSFAACNNVMWKGISANDGCIVLMNESSIADAENAFKALNSAILIVDGSELVNNRVAFSVPGQGQYNSVSISVSNTSAHAEGPLAQPYANQTSVLGDVGYAAFDVNDMSLDFTGGGNSIHHMSNGIVAHGSDVSEEGCTFNDIQPDAAYTDLGVANGSAIYADSEGAWSSLKQYGYGSAATDQASFSYCRWGLYTNNMNVVSAHNRMTDMGTAHRIEHSFYREVRVFDNRVHCKYHGMDLRFNDGANSVLVEGNHITFGDDQECISCRGYCGIRVAEALGTNPSSIIRHNTLQFVSNPASRHGINLSSAANWQALDNTISMTHRQHSLNGIITSGCQRVVLSCNTVDNTDPQYATYSNLAQSGIRNWEGQDMLISCNTVDRTTNGMLLSGYASDVDLKGNTFRNHRWGLHLEFDAIIGEQFYKGNTWQQAAPSGGYQAYYENATNADLYKFKVNGSLQPPSGGSYVPTSIWPAFGWFLNMQEEPNYDCESDFACDGLGERCTGCSPELMQRIADGTLDNADYTPETRWTMKGDLYELLTEEPERLIGNPLLQEFYTDVETEVLAQLKQLEGEQLALYGLDATVSAALALGAAQLVALRLQLHAEVQAVGDESITAAQRLAHAQAINTLQASIAALLAYHGDALSLATNSRALTAEGVRATNAAIATGDHIEANNKTVNEVHLATLAKNITDFTPAQAEALLAVADQCPLSGGNAVFRARSLYSLIDDAHEYDDAALCLQQGLITKRRPMAAQLLCALVPNPAKDQALLILDAALKDPSSLVMVNAMGAEVLRTLIPADQPRTEVNLAGLASGIYHYTLVGATGVIGRGKLAVER